MANANQFALDKLKDAAFIHFGVDKAVKNTAIYIQTRFHVQEQVKITAAVYKIIKDKRISINYQEKTFTISPNYLEIMCHF